MSGRRAIFLDRDGVLNDVVWRDGKAASPRQLSELAITPSAAQVVADFQAAGYLTFVVTNQPDVRRRLMSAEILEEIHAELRLNVRVDDLAVCLHDDRDGCDCRKPKAGMLLDLARRWNVDLAESWMVGDQDRDVLCGQAAGVSTVLLRRPYNTGEADLVVADLAEAGRLILEHALPRAHERQTHVC